MAESNSTIPVSTWQPDLFRPTCAESLAVQGELFAKPETPPRAPRLDAQGQTHLLAGMIA